MRGLCTGVLGVLLLSTVARAAGEPWPNPLIRQRADPYVIRHTDGYYYFMATVPEYDRLELRRAKDIAGLAGAAPKVIWRKHDKGPMGSHVWAPEIHFIDGKWYVYFAAGGAEKVWDIRIYVLENSSPDPLDGEWTEKGQLKTNWESFALDATPFERAGSRYLVWAQHDPAVKNNTNLYVAKMEAPWSIVGKQVMISEPDLDWEQHLYKVNEGPAVLQRNGRIFITYSASGTDANYCMGMLTARDDADLLDPKSWAKSPRPVFRTSEENHVFGPGHNSFTTTPDGRDVLVYHARSYREIKGDPLHDPNRDTRAQFFSWKPDGTPDFGVPIAETVPAATVTTTTATTTQSSTDDGPADHLPPHITRLTHFGERADFSHDGRKILFLSKTFGDAMEYDRRTKTVRNLTAHYPHCGYTRALYLANDDILLSGPESFDPKDVRAARTQCSLYVLDKSLTKSARPLGTKCSEGPAVSRKRMHIAWTHVAAEYPDEMPPGSSRMQEADVVIENGTAHLANRRVIITSGELPFKCTLETQNFRPPDEKELTFSAYGHQGTEVCGIDLSSKKVTNYSNAPGQYDEPEGVYPDGRYTLVECDRQNHLGPGHVDLWKLRLDGSGRTERLTWFSDVAGYKASNPVVSDDGRYVAFQMAKSRDAAGVGYGIFLYDVGRAPKSAEAGR